MTAVPQTPAVELLDQLDALRAAATADLPWRVGDHYGIHVYGGPDEQTPIGTCHQEADAELIVAAVNALPSLIAVIRDVLYWHQRVRGGSDAGFCNGCDVPWPCPTYRAIAAALTDGTPR